MIKNIILVTLILSLFVAGCQKAEEPITPTETGPDTSMGSDVSEVDSIDKDLNSGELDKLESELDEINW